MDIQEIESAHNFFEHIVLEEISNSYYDKNLSPQEYADLFCIALNLIPPKYICNDVDTYFFMTIKESEENIQKVKLAVASAYQKLKTLVI